MKYLIMLTFLPLSVSAQEWKEQYITIAGDTIKPKSRIEIADRLPIHHIYPYGIQAQGAKVPAKLFLLTDMPGKTYKIDRLTRIPIDEGYKAVAVLEINHPDIMRGYAVDFYIDIEAALKAGEITIRKTQ